MSNQMTHLQIDAAETNPGSGIKLFGMLISAPPLPSSNAAQTVPQPIHHHTEDSSTCVTKSGSLKEDAIFEFKQASLEIGGFGTAFDETAANSSRSDAGSLVGRLREAPTSVKSKNSCSSARAGPCRRTVNEHFDSTEGKREVHLKMDGSEKTDPRKLDDRLPCPRCNSWQTKFCYFNNYNFNQPRHFCRQCQRYWTAGGTLRNLPMGAGRRKRKLHYHMTDAAVDRAIAIGNAADAAQQLLLYYFSKPCAIDTSISAPRVSMFNEVLPERELSLTAQSDISDHVSIEQMYKAGSDCDEPLCHEKMLPLEYGIGPNIVARRGPPRSVPEVPACSESFNDSWGAAPEAAMLAAVVAATKPYFDLKISNNLGKHPRDATYEGVPKRVKLKDPGIIGDNILLTTLSAGSNAASGKTFKAFQPKFQKWHSQSGAYQDNRLPFWSNTEASDVAPVLYEHQHLRDL